MSHSSVSTTVRAAKNLGFRCTLVEDACATRDLPYKGGILSAEHVQQTEMAIMADNFATLALTKDAAKPATRRRRQLLGPLGRKRRASKPSDIFIPTFPPGYRPFDRTIHRLFREQR